MRPWPVCLMESSTNRMVKDSGKIHSSLTWRTAVASRASPCCHFSSSIHCQNRTCSMFQFMSLASYFTGSWMEALNGSMGLTTKSQIIRMVFKAYHTTCFLVTSKTLSPTTLVLLTSQFLAQPCRTTCSNPNRIPASASLLFCVCWGGGGKEREEL